jgi:hypothetical protein
LASFSTTEYEKWFVVLLWLLVASTFEVQSL